MKRRERRVKNRRKPMAPKSKRSVKTSNETDVARKIWLAGVGAYGRIFDEAQDQVSRLSHNAQEMFDDLVVRGEKVEDEVRSRISKSETGARVVKFVERAQEFGAERRRAFEKRVSAARARVTETLSAPVNMLMLSQTVEALAKRVEALTGLKAPVRAAKPAVKAAKGAKAKAAKIVRKGKAVRAPKVRMVEGVDASQQDAA
jgi:poly(hydroxyalkanoate) granule-associated protein